MGSLEAWGRGGNKLKSSYDFSASTGVARRIKIVVWEDQ